MNAVKIPPMKPTVLELLHARLADPASRPGARNDPWKLAVVAEGGGMRWTVAAGMMSRLEEAGILPDLIVGTSGGGLASAYYAAGHVRYGSRNAYHLNSKGYQRDGGHKFIDVKRALKGQPVMDVEGAVEISFSQCVPLDWQALRQSPVETYMTAVSADGQLMLQPLHDVDEASQKRALKNSGRVPAIAHPARDERVLWDGMLKASLPVDEAFALGATHVLALRCAPAHEGYNPRPDGFWKYAVIPLLRRQNRNLADLMRQSFQLNSLRLNTLAQNPRPDVEVWALPQVHVSVSEGDENKLLNQLVTAYRFAEQKLQLAEAPLPAVWFEAPKATAAQHAPASPDIEISFA